MTSEEITKEITLSMINDESLFLTSDSKTNKLYADEIVNFFKIVYKGIEEVQNTPAEDITMGIRK